MGDIDYTYAYNALQCEINKLRYSMDIFKPKNIIKESWKQYIRPEILEAAQEIMEWQRQNKEQWAVKEVDIVGSCVFL